MKERPRWLTPIMVLVLGGAALLALGIGAHYFRATYTSAACFGFGGKGVSDVTFDDRPVRLEEGCVEYVRLPFVNHTIRYRDDQGEHLWEIGF